MRAGNNTSRSKQPGQKQAAQTEAGGTNKAGGQHTNAADSTGSRDTVTTAVLLLVCAIFIAINGRNDGAPLTAVALQARGERGWAALIYLWLLLPIVPLLGFWGVADSLYKMLGVGSQSPGRTIALITAVLLTILLSNLAGIPTSITLALVGALAGVGWATGAGISGALLIRVLSLGLAAPIVAALIAYGLGRVRLRDTRATRNIVLTYQKITLPLLITAYAANDGQKMAFVIALALGATVPEVATMPVALFIGSTIFIVGVLFGLRSSGKFVRHGITSVRPMDLLWAETGASIAVLGGSALGVPLSMTQSVTGAVAGVGLSRSTRAIYWRSVGRIGIAWVWTLPVASGLAYVFVSLM